MKVVRFVRLLSDTLYTQEERRRMKQHNSFYDSPEWRAKRRQILAADRHECQECKRRGRYSRAVIVHHVQHLEDHPELALSDVYTDAHGVERRQLVSVCRDCHETVCHPERLRRTEPDAPPTVERWD